MVLGGVFNLYKIFLAKRVAPPFQVKILFHRDVWSSNFVAFREKKNFSHGKRVAFVLVQNWRKTKKLLGKKLLSKLRFVLTIRLLQSTLASEFRKKVVKGIVACTIRFQASRYLFCDACSHKVTCGESLSLRGEIFLRFPLTVNFIIFAIHA